MHQRHLLQLLPTPPWRLHPRQQVGPQASWAHADELHPCSSCCPASRAAEAVAQCHALRVVSMRGGIGGRHGAALHDLPVVPTPALHPRLCHHFLLSSSAVQSFHAFSCLLAPANACDNPRTIALQAPGSRPAQLAGSRPPRQTTCTADWLTSQGAMPPCRCAACCTNSHAAGWCNAAFWQHLSFTSVTAALQEPGLHPRESSHVPAGLT
jgi:hypothetical protein